MSFHRALLDQDDILTHDADLEARERVRSAVRQTSDFLRAREAHEHRLHDDRWKALFDKVNARFDPPVAGAAAVSKISGLPLPVSEELANATRMHMGLLPYVQPPDEPFEGQDDPYG
jgi:hypothetical protein